MLSQPRDVIGAVDENELHGLGGRCGGSHKIEFQGRDSMAIEGVAVEVLDAVVEDAEEGRQ